MYLSQRSQSGRNFPVGEFLYFIHWEETRSTKSLLILLADFFANVVPWTKAGTVDQQTWVTSIRLPAQDSQAMALPKWDTQPLEIRFISIIKHSFVTRSPKSCSTSWVNLAWGIFFFFKRVREKTGVGLGHLDHSLARHLLREMLHIDERSDALPKLGKDLDPLGGIWVVQICLSR